ncbi:unnamed protein product [Vicia faba]|uniref:Uncharacterized protein n=1 Tax=Vicia faba TaxID=3906 RepID=A0AAV0ZLG9_VICFA|nr:unnamed protein product [Vicia faba]
MGSGSWKDPDPGREKNKAEAKKKQTLRNARRAAAAGTPGTLEPWPPPDLKNDRSRGGGRCYWKRLEQWNLDKTAIGSCEVTDWLHPRKGLIWLVAHTHQLATIRKSCCTGTRHYQSSLNWGSSTSSINQSQETRTDSQNLLQYRFFHRFEREKKDGCIRVEEGYACDLQYAMQKWFSSNVLCGNGIWFAMDYAVVVMVWKGNMFCNGLRRF